MSIAIDLIIVAIVAFCAWRGFKSGIIRGVCGILTLIISLIVANIVATAYSGEFTGMLTPFVSGVVDSALSDILDLDDEDSYSAYETNAGTFTTAASVLAKLGLPENAADRVARMAIDDAGGDSNTLSDIITEKFSSVLAYVAVFGICFILMAIIFAVIGNLINLVFSIPGLSSLDAIAGALFGLAKGLIIVFAIAVIVRYAGILAPDALEKTSVLKYIVNSNPIANILGI